MGYTHYFSTKSEFNQEKWDKEFLPAVKKIVTSSSCPIGNSSGEPNTDPLYGMDCILLNGVGEDSYETMEISRIPKEFYFCKTARKPYDSVCVAIAILAEEIFKGQFTWSSDGEGEDDYKIGGLVLLDLADLI